LVDRWRSLAEIAARDFNVAILGQLPPPELTLDNDLEPGPLEMECLDAPLRRRALIEEALQKRFRQRRFGAASVVLPVRQPCAPGRKRMLIHGIEAADEMAELSALNKLNADWGNLTYLMKVGRERADA
jgi:hypothetical protein